MVSGHIPSGATPCQSCHAISFASFFITGTPQMTVADHTAMFAVIGGSCDACHESGKSFTGVSGLTTRPNGHHVGQDCSGCHSPNKGWNGNMAKKKIAATTTATTTTRSTIGTVVNAPAVSQSSATAAGTGSASRGVVTPGAPLLNRTNGAAALRGAGVAGPMGSASVSHAGVTTNCVSCHNGVLARGKGATHIASNNSCENCHTTIAWMPARFEHRGVTASCASCHNGVAAAGKPARHVPTTQDCSACHGTISWAAATFNHMGINATCQSCHNGITATAKQVQHVTTTLDCGSCHNTMSWTVTTPRAPLKPLIQRPNPLPSPGPSPRGATSGPTK
jgi:hypothetical protein